MHRHGAARTELRAVAVLLIVFLDQYRVISDAAILAGLGTACGGMSCDVTTRASATSGHGLSRWTSFAMACACCWG